MDLEDKIKKFVENLLEIDIDNPEEVKTIKDTYNNLSQETKNEFLKNGLNEVFGEVESKSLVYLSQEQKQEIENFLTKNITNQNFKRMETIELNQEQEKEFEKLKKTLKYLGFGDAEELHKELEKGIAGTDKQFTVNTSSDRTNFGNKLDYSLNFNKSEKGGVFLNSFDTKLTTTKGEEKTHQFAVNKNMVITAKQALNLMEGRATKIEYIPKAGIGENEEKPKAFIKLNMNSDKNEKGNYEIDFYTENYGVNTAKIVEKSEFVFDSEREKENVIKHLEKGNITDVKYENNGVLENGKAILNPQYKFIQIYTPEMKRVNTNKGIKGIEEEQGKDKSNTRQHHQSRRP